MRRPAGVFLIFLVLLVLTVPHPGYTGGSADVKRYDSLFVFRVDDVGGAYSGWFNRTNHLFVTSSTPVTYAVVPEALKQKGNVSRHCERFRSLGERYPGLVHYALHGWNHSMKGDPPTEFAGRSLAEQRRKLSNGKDFLESCVGQEIEVVVPPGNTYDNTTLKAMRREGLKMVSGWKGYPDSTEEKLKQGEDPERIYQVGVDSVYVLNWSTGEIRPPEDVFREQNSSRKSSDIHVQMLHPNRFDSEAFELLERQIKRTRKNDTLIVNLGQLTKLISREDLRFDEKALKWELVR